MSQVTKSSEEISAKVAEILANSANEPGIHEMMHLLKMTETVRQVEQAYSDMSIPPLITQTSNLNT